MSVGDIRSPVRPLEVGAATSKIYPGELLIDPSTGNFKYYDSTKTAIDHKKPGTLTVTQGSTTVLSQTDLSENVTLQLPEHPTYTEHSEALYTIAVNNLGHVSSATAVQFDDEPTEDSENLMTSGAIYDMYQEIIGMIAAISITVQNRALLFKTEDTAEIDEGESTLTLTDIGVTATYIEGNTLHIYSAEEEEEEEEVEETTGEEETR